VECPKRLQGFINGLLRALAFTGSAETKRPRRQRRGQEWQTTTVAAVASNISQNYKQFTDDAAGAASRGAAPTCSGLQSSGLGIAIIADFGSD